MKGAWREQDAGGILRMKAKPLRRGGSPALDGEFTKPAK
jgi:hypothetical protein